MKRIFLFFLTLFFFLSLSNSNERRGESVMVYIPGGEFTFGGSANTRIAECKRYGGNPVSETSPRVINLGAFWIEQTEVTNAMYARCVTAGACEEPLRADSSTRPNYYGNPKFDNYPVIHVNWNMANTYCEWLGRRLPTEAEWEKAALGANGNLYPWGNFFDGARANFCDSRCLESWANQSLDDGYAELAPVGSYPTGQSVYGALDMAGNVWEWVSDKQAETHYQNSSSAAPEGIASAESRITRGGSWSAVIYADRYAFRAVVSPNFSSDDIGFRCAFSP